MECWHARWDWGSEMDCTSCGKKLTARWVLFRLIPGIATECGWDFGQARFPSEFGTDAGFTWYCSAQCKESDLRECHDCRKHYSLKLTGTAEGDSLSHTCPNCQQQRAEIERKVEEIERKVEEIEAAVEWIQQQLLALAHTGEATSLLSYVEQHTEDPEGYLRLGHRYYSYWETWHEKLSSSLLKDDVQEKLLERPVEIKEKQQWLLREAGWRILDASYGAAAATVSELARESFQKAIALKPSPLQEAMAHRQIARMWLGSRLQLSVQHCLELDSRFDILYSRFGSHATGWIYTQHGHRAKAHRRESETRARAALRAAIKAANQHLRTNPYDMEALELLEFAYQTLDRADELYEVRVRIKGAEVVAGTGESRQGVNAKRPQAGPNSGIPFEEKCLHILQGMGFTVSSTASTNDGGIDIVATHRSPIIGGKYVVQCKDWASKVGVAVVRELYGVVTAEGVNKGILITSSGFTKGAMEFAHGKPLELIDGEQLEHLARERLGDTGGDDGGV